MIRSTFAKSFHRLLSHTTSPSPTPTPPPSHFSNPKEIPPTYSEEVFQPQPLTSQQAQAQAQQHHPHDQSGQPPVISTGTASTTTTGTDSKTTQKPHDGSIREITALIAMFALAYIAIDNYTERIRLDKLHTETTAINLKALQIQQVNYQREKQARESKMLQERKEFSRRDFKMGLHVALLRKQLVDLGYEPVDIDAAIKEFEKNVKQDNSIKHVNNQYLWLDDKSDLKPYLPDPAEYDKAKKKK